jgi:ATP-dependent helicase/nuclease subunit B
MKGRVEVLCGVAGAGKTTRLLNIFRGELRRLGAEAMLGQAVWITPTARSRREIRQALLDQTLGVCFAPNVFTFDAFAERLLQTIGTEITPISRVAQRMIVRTIIDEALASGSLEYFSPIAETSGFLDLVLGLIAELKRDETEPDDFAKVCRKRNSARDRELLLIYRRYQERLTDLSLYDAEGRFWAARLELANGRRGAFDPLSLLVVDGFADFTQPQYEILEHLSRYAQRMLVSLPLEEPLRRSDLFAKSHKALEEIRRRCQVELVPLCPSVDGESSPVARAGQDEPASLGHVAEHLFDNPRTVPQLADATGIEVIAAAGPAGEARAVAERVKSLLLEGTSAQDIVVAVRSLNEEGADLLATLRGAGIPVCCEIGTRFSQTAVARMLFAVLQVELQDWTFSALCPVLRSNYFRPRWSVANLDLAVESTIRVLRRYQLGSDRQHILNRLARLAESPPSATSDANRKEETRIAAKLLDAFSDALKRLRSPKEFSGWIDALWSLAGELGIEPRPRSGGQSPPAALEQSDLDDRDRYVWNKLGEVVREAAQVRVLLEDRRPLSLAEFVRLLRDVLESQTIVDPLNERGRVRVVEASDVRNLDVPHLFVVGLSEASFPRGRRDDCFYSAAERRDIIRKDHSGSAPSTTQQDEMLLFYSIVTRARRRLTLSYPSVSAAGLPLFPSPYVTAIRDLFYKSALKPTAKIELDPVPTQDRVLSSSDLRLAATDELRAGRPGLFRTLAENRSEEEAARAILATADMDASRFEQRGFTPFEGLLEHPPTIARLTQRFSPEYQFSPTQLERYATCPFRFLLGEVLKLDPYDPVEAEIDPRKRGLAFHRVLAKLHRQVAELSLTKPQDQRAFLETLRELIGAEFAVGEDIPAYERALQSAELEFANRFVELYGQQCEEYLGGVGEDWDEPPAPHHLERAFGAVRARPDAETSADPPLPCAVFGPGESPVRVCGRIDRIDVGRRGGKSAYTVIDYKTRWTPRFQFADIQSGRALQLAIYASAARRSGLVDPEASPFQMAYWSLTLAGCVVGLKGTKKTLEMLDPELVGEMEQTLDTLLPKITTQLRAGQFPVINADKECGKWCPYSTACRVGQVRSLADEHQKVWSLPER